MDAEQLSVLRAKRRRLERRRNDILAGVKNRTEKWSDLQGVCTQIEALNRQMDVTWSQTAAKVAGAEGASELSSE